MIKHLMTRMLLTLTVGTLLGLVVFAGEASAQRGRGLGSRGDSPRIRLDVGVPQSSVDPGFLPGPGVGPTCPQDPVVPTGFGKGVVGPGIGGPSTKFLRPGIGGPGFGIRFSPTWGMQYQVVRTTFGAAIQVQQTQFGGPASRTGLEPGDLILSIDRRPIVRASRQLECARGRTRLTVVDVRTGRTIRTVAFLGRFGPRFP